MAERKKRRARLMSKKPDRFPQEVWDGAARILAELREVPADYRLDAYALATRAAIETSFMGDTWTVTHFGEPDA